MGPSSKNQVVKAYRLLPRDDLRTQTCLFLANQSLTTVTYPTGARSHTLYHDTMDRPLQMSVLPKLGNIHVVIFLRISLSVNLFSVPQRASESFKI
jgi:hypothetical protein